jgi:hypothetical protein
MMVKMQDVQTVHTNYIHSFIPLACAEFDDSLPFSAASSIPPCYILFPATLHPSSLTSSCHPFLGLPLNLVVPKFICNTLSGILFPSTLCTCPNQHIQFYFFPLSVHVQTNVIYLTLLSLL